MAPGRKLTLIQMNDSHAYFEAHPELFWVQAGGVYRPAGGYARIATLLKQIRRESGGATIALDNGDTFHGTYAAVQTQGEALLPILNALAFDAMTAHWEFDYGPARVKELAGRLDYPLLAVNCYEQGTGERVFPAHTVVETGGVRVGVIGIAATIVDKVMPPHFSEGVRFTLGRDELPAEIEMLRRTEKADLIVVLSHLGFPQDMQLAHDVDGIDILLSGHTHNRLKHPARVNRTLVIQSGAHGSFLGRLDVEVEGGQVVEASHRLLPVSGEIAPDPDVQALVEQALAPYTGMLGEVVGETATPLNRYTALEATMDTFLLHSLRALTGDEIAFSNGWRYGAPVPPGPVTLNDLYNIVPMNPPVSRVSLTGREVQDMLEQNLQHTFSRNPYQQMGGYVKRTSGLSMAVKVENPAGERIQEMFIGGEPVQADRRYDAAFVTTQGVPPRYGTDRVQLDVRAVEAMRQYLAAHRPLNVEIEGAVVLV